MDAARAQDTLDLKGDCHGDSRSRLFLRFGAGRNHLSGFAALLIELRQARGSGAVTVPPLGRTVLCEIRTDHTGQRNAGAASVRIGNIAHSNLASRQRNCGSPVIGTAGYGPLRMAENDQSSDSAARETADPVWLFDQLRTAAECCEEGTDEFASETSGSAPAPSTARPT